MPAGVGGVASRGVPLSRSRSNSGHYRTAGERVKSDSKRAFLFGPGTEGLRSRRDERAKSTHCVATGHRTEVGRKWTRQGKLRGLEFERRQPGCPILLPSLGSGQETRRDRQAPS